MHLGDDAEAAEPADLQLGEVVAGDVLDHPPAGLHQPAVAGRDGAAEHVIAHRAEAMTQRARGAGGHDRAEAPLGPARRIERRATSLRPRAAGAAPRSACRPARSRRGRPGLTESTRSSARVLTARSAGASAGSQVPWPSTRIFQPSSCASRQTSESASAVVRHRAGTPVGIALDAAGAEQRAQAAEDDVAHRAARRRAPFAAGVDAARPCRDWRARRDRRPDGPRAWRRASRRRRCSGM